MLLNSHCGKSGCMCTHTEPCEYGFIWVDYYEEVPVKSRDGSTKVTAEARGGVRFCPTCSPDRAHIQKSVKTTLELGEKLRARSNANRVKSYEEHEGSKTRAL